MERLTQKDEQGNWSLRGVPWESLYEGKVITKELWERLYGALWKLMEYEDTGLSPEEVEKVNDFVNSQAGTLLKKLNEEQRKHRWIPVEERLPESREDVLVCVKSGLILAAWYGSMRKKWHIALSDECMIHEGIVAWQPLPKPYREEGER